MLKLGFIWQRLSNIGVDSHTDPQIRRKVILTNQIAVTVSCIMLSYFILLFMLFKTIQFLILISCVFYILTLFFNKLRWHNFSRLWFNFWPPVIILCISVFFTKEMIIILKFALFAVILIPIILFRIEEKWKLTSGIIWVIGCSMGIDAFSSTVKNAFGIVPVIPISALNSQITSSSLLSYCLLIFSFIYFQKLNSTAEKQLAEKTRQAEELLLKEQALNNHLEEERNILKLRNDIIENDLAIARKIQMQYIPSKAPFNSIAFYYKSMAQIGGDFYDFIRFKNDEKIGIFISDVSGHGVGAAFITSMIKSILQQSRPFIDKPSQVLAFLNDSILDQTGGQFVTAFYGVLNRKSLHFSYSNAGHNPPYLINKENVEYLRNDSSGIPLAVLHSSEFPSIRKEYQDCSLQLNPGTKLLLYTDGLTEAIQDNKLNLFSNYDDFENNGLKPLLSDLSKHPAQEFIKLLTQHLIQFRGSENFEDDVCMICLDI